MAILAAKFRGFEFDIESVDETISRAIVKKEYPYQDGATTQDLGRNGRPIVLTAVIYGPEFIARVAEFLVVLNTPGPGELIHPLFGPLNVQFYSSRQYTDYQRSDLVKLQLEFWESGIDQPLFNRKLPSQAAAAIDPAIDTALDAAEEQLEEDIQELIDADLLAAIALVADMLQVLAALADLIALIDVKSTYTPLASSASANSPYLRTPGTFAGQLAKGYIAAIDSLTATDPATASVSSGASATASFEFVVQQLGSVILPARPTVILPAQNTLPTARNTANQPQPFLVAHLAIQQTLAIASAAAQLYSAELAGYSMTPPQISAIAASVRTRINATIAIVQQTYPDLVRQQPLIDPLAAVALSISDAAEQILRARPPLIQRKIDAPANLTLIAHFWYADHSRSAELLRLNPQIINPNFVARGTVLQGYAT